MAIAKQSRPTGNGNSVARRGVFRGLLGGGLALLALTLGACAAEARCNAEAGAPVPFCLVVLGSSTAAGIGPAKERNAWVNRYRSYCQEVLPGCRVVNLGRDWFRTYKIMPTGYPTPEGRPRASRNYNITRALSLEPDVIIINLPSNDTDLGYPVEEQMGNYRVLRAAAEAEGVALWVTTPQPRSDFSAAKRRELLRLRDTTYDLFGARTLDFWTGLATSEGRIAATYNSGDDIHLNDAGHRVLFERVRDAGVIEDIIERSQSLGSPATAADGPA